MLGHGVSQQLVGLMRNGISGKHSYRNSGLYLGETVMATLFKTMSDSLHQIPTSFDGSFHTPSSKHTTRAVDWIDIVRFVIPVLVVPKLSNHQAQLSVLNLVKFMQIALQKTISTDQLEEMDR
jgi:hypothetical protein